MPIYEYTCKSCNKPFEQLHRTITSEPKVKCPECGSSKTSRAFSVFAVGAEGSAAQSPRQSAGGGCGHCHEPGGCGMG